MAYPENLKDQFTWLVNEAERCIKSNRPSPKRRVLWWKRAVDWLKTNTPNSDLSRQLLVIRKEDTQKGFKILIKAQPLVPSLRVRSTAGAPKPENLKRIFIVHGHDETLKRSVKQFLISLGLRPVVLHEQPERGRTLIEKVLHHSEEVGFAVVLLTADDKGGEVRTPVEGYQYRARQNVIMELGLFIGKLGRENVAAIYDEKVEIPSDYRGVILLPRDAAGTWRKRLVKEIRAAGIPIKIGPAATISNG